MKLKRNLTIIISLLCIALTLTSCALLSAPSNKTGGESTKDKEYLDTITRLESEISKLKTDQIASEEYYKQLIESLKGQSPTPPDENQDIPTGAVPTESTYKYTTDGKKATITGYIGSEEDLVIPATIDGYIVSAIGDRAFEGNKKLRSITVPESVTSIGWFAFYNCGALESIRIPYSVTSIGYSVFDGCDSEFKIFCAVGSYAEKFAKSYGMNYSTK